MQTSRRFAPPPTRACTRWRFGRHARLVLLFAWLTLWPTDRCLPQTSQARAMEEVLNTRAGAAQRARNVGQAMPLVQPSARSAAANATTPSATRSQCHRRQRPRSATTSASDRPGKPAVGRLVDEQRDDDDPGGGAGRERRPARTIREPGGRGGRHRRRTEREHQRAGATRVTGEPGTEVRRRERAPERHEHDGDHQHAAGEESEEEGRQLREHRGPASRSGCAG